MHDPPVLMLDEMTSHLDILIAHEVLTFVEPFSTWRISRELGWMELSWMKLR